MNEDMETERVTNKRSLEQELSEVTKRKNLYKKKYEEVKEELLASLRTIEKLRQEIETLKTDKIVTSGQQENNKSHESKRGHGNTVLKETLEKSGAELVKFNPGLEFCKLWVNLKDKKLFTKLPDDKFATNHTFVCERFPECRNRARKSSKCQNCLQNQHLQV